MKKVALIQARMSSTRLPGKVLQDIGGWPMLLRVANRVRKAMSIDLAAVVTSTHSDDDAIGRLCEEHCLPCFRGSLDDVLDRYYQAALHFQADVIVRITADCPLLDPEIVNLVVRSFQDGSYDYVSNTLECTYPDGLDTEIFRFETLKRAWQEAQLKSEREHVTAYIYKHPELFRLGSIKQEKDLSALRWTVDTAKDLEFVRRVYQHFRNDEFGMDDVLGLIETDPEMGRLNTRQVRNEGYQKSLRKDMELSEKSR
jgi:spore coat polysaccharide biosynthesis protein SpsF